MNDAQIIEQLGGPTKVAELLKFEKAGGVQRVQNWISRGIPARVKLDHPEIFAREPQPKDHHIHWPEMALGQQTHGPEAIETIAISNDTLSPVCDLPPIVSAPAAPAWDGIDRRGPVARPVPPELDRRAALAGHTGV